MVILATFILNVNMVQFIEGRLYKKASIEPVHGGTIKTVNIRLTLK